MIALPCKGHASSFHVLDVIEHKLYGIDRWLTRNEDHWNVSIRDQGTAVRRCKKKIIVCAPHGVLVWQLTT